METNVIKEKPIFELFAYNADGEERRINVFACDLKTAEVGRKWEAYVGACYRSEEESIEIVYKNDSGVAVLHRTFGMDNAEDYEDEPELVWVELH